MLPMITYHPPPSIKINNKIDVILNNIFVLYICICDFSCKTIAFLPKPSITYERLHDKLMQNCPFYPLGLVLVEHKGFDFNIDDKCIVNLHV